MWTEQNNNLVRFDERCLFWDLWDRLLTGILADLSTIWDTVEIFSETLEETHMRLLRSIFPRKNIFESSCAFNLISFLETQSTLKRSHLCLFLPLGFLQTPHTASIRPRFSAAHHPWSPSLSPSLRTQMCQSWWVVSRVRWHRARATKSVWLEAAGEDL